MTDFLLRQEEFLRLFDNQTILLLGLPGAGKSSLINSFFYVVSGKYKELAEVGHESSTSTRYLRKYSCSNPSGKTFIAFLDTGGLPSRRGLGPFITDLIRGQIKLNSDFDAILDGLVVSGFNADTYKWTKTTDSEEEKQSLPSAVLVVLDGTVEPPEIFLKSVQDAVRPSRLPVFVLATRKDNLPEEKEKVLFQKDVRTLLPDCSSVSFISNYLPYLDLKKYPINKQIDLIDAFIEIFDDGKSQAEGLSSLYSGQKILLLGTKGAGKSSIINSFFSIATRKYEELAEVSSEDQLKTRHVNVFPWPRGQGQATFIDTCGMPPYNGFSSVLEDLIDGSLPPKTDMKRILEEISDADNEGKDCSKTTCPYYHEQRNEDTGKQSIKPSVVLLVVDPTSSLPTVFLTELKHVFEERRKKRPDLAVFVMATRADVFSAKAENFEEEIKKYFDCRVFRVANWTPTGFLGKSRFFDAFREIAESSQ